MKNLCQYNYCLIKIANINFLCKYVLRRPIEQNLIQNQFVNICTLLDLLFFDWIYFNSIQCIEKIHQQINCELLTILHIYFWIVYIKLVFCIDLRRIQLNNSSLITLKQNVLIQMKMRINFFFILWFWFIDMKLGKTIWNAVLKNFIKIQAIFIFIWNCRYIF